MSPKSDAWNLMGGLFWSHGRESAKPSKSEIDELINGVAGKKCLVIGATTVGMINAAVHQAAEIHVFDFAQAVIDATKGLVPNCVEFHNVDILESIPGWSCGYFELICAERLVNRFERHQVSVFSRHCSEMLCTSGLLRTVVRIGFYPMDFELLALASRNGRLSNIYDPDSATIDYSQAAEELQKLELSHGDIPKDKLKDWYIGRGKESRYTYSDVQSLLTEPSTLALEDLHHCPQAPNSLLCSLKKL